MIVLVFLVALCGVFLTREEAQGAPAPITCIAHRGGAAGGTEETLPTYQQAVADGSTFLEGDVRFTRTGFPYMLHNADMGVFGAPTVLLADISGSQAETYLSPSTGQDIASLYDLRQLLIANPGVRLQAEMKDSMTEDRWDLIDTRLASLRDRVEISAFSLATVRAAQDRGYRAVRLTSADTANEAADVAQGAASISSADVLQHAAVGNDVQAWTPNSATEWSRLADAGVTKLITDDPVGCASWAANRS